ncbi:MAG: SIS domain-containing protein [Anaerolineae bacterium]|jgi:glucosamine--fructose-6-phosphate aminotransferase (isomerizing)|nr:SIS domain-containing protein [Anaerolineae bacterium]
MNYFREQILTLPRLINDVVEPFLGEATRALDDVFCRSLERLHLIGCGDSHFAALATEFAFESIAGVPTEAQSAMSFSRYGVINFDVPGFAQHPGTSAVIGISVSGGVTRTIEGIVRAKARGLRTFAVTSGSHTPIAQAADAVLTTRAPDVPNAAGVQVPGARSYFASLVMLYACALRMAEARGHNAQRWRAMLLNMGMCVQQTIEMSDAAARTLAERTLDAGEFVFCGSGPNFGTAQFCAAKVLEASGDSAVGQDVEEWAHLQYFARTADTPTFLITARERDVSRAIEVETAMQAIGRRVVVVSPAQDHEGLHLRYAPCPEAFAPLVACIPGMLFAAHRAELLGEPYFRAFGGGRSIEAGGGISRIRTSELVA